jgi:putative restriction endonuclease
MVSLYVAVTDWEWFSFLRSRPDLVEVNFWQPGGRTEFHVLQPGELFLFKLHSPKNFIAGCGIYANQSIIPISTAWGAFGDSNGATSLAEMRERVARYRRTESDSAREDYRIGCRILTQPSFWSEHLWIRTPETWSRNIVVGKRYDTDSEEGRELWESALERMSAPVNLGMSDRAARYGDPVLIAPRLGQGAFRVGVVEAYSRRCAVTGEKTLPALEAAHIRPYADGGTHEISNGILMRRDLHTLFDLGYVTVARDFRFEVSKKIKEEYENGREYYALHGRQVLTPSKQIHQPDRQLLSWHSENIFKG